MKLDKCKVGMRVVIYSGVSRSTGVITDIFLSGTVFVQLDGVDNFKHHAHPQQLRLLRKKQKTTVWTWAEIQEAFLKVWPYASFEYVSDGGNLTLKKALEAMKNK